MNYVKKGIKYLTPNNSTYSEEEEKQYSKLKPFPAISRKTILILGILLVILNSAQIFSFHGTETYAEDGAGDYWRCSWCGYSSNKCYEMSCSRCGKSR